MRYTTPTATGIWVERTAPVVSEDPDFTMYIDGLSSVQLYDVEFYFSGNVVGSSFEASYYDGYGGEQNLFSGDPAIMFDSNANVTRVSGRTSVRPIGNLGRIEAYFDDASTGYSFNFILNP